MSKTNFVVKTTTIEYTIVFVHKGIEHNHTFNPKDSEDSEDSEDYWTAFESNGLTFDVNYDKDYNFIVVYEVIDGKGDYEHSVCNIKLTDI